MLCGLREATTSDKHRLLQVLQKSRISGLIDRQIGDALKPTTFEVFNDSNKHAHHKAMQGVTSREVCFAIILLLP
jgi:stress-induced morphogen